MPIAFGSKALSETEMRYSAPKSEMLAAIYFIEKYRPYLTRGVFTLRADNQALSWLKRYSMTRGMAARWIQRLDQYKFHVEHRKREKHQNVDSLSKKTEFYTKREEKDASLPPEMENFKFLADPDLYRRLPAVEEKVDVLELEEVDPHTKHPSHCRFSETPLDPAPPEEWIFAVSGMVPEYTQQGVFAVVKEHAAHRYRMSDLIRAQNDDHAVKCLKLLVAGWQGLLPKCDGRLATKVKSYYFKYKGLFVENNEGIILRRRKPTELTTHVNDLVILPALFQMEALHLAHDAQRHVGQTKVIQMILQ